MPVVVPVKFAYASRDLWFDPKGLDIVQGDHAICSTERGTEIGLVTADPFEVPASELAAPLKPVLRVATDIDLELANDLAIQGEEAMEDFRRLVKQNGLEMKPVGVEYLFGGEKAVFYFAAEDRVDFRQLVKDLSSCFHIRVDMRQIGVRDETRLVGGYATCGQELCCARFGGQFEPVSIRMAKEQDLPLNSSKISGVCGRLMCCLRYEFEAYKDFKGRAPKKKALIDTPLGKARIVEYNTPREQLVLRLESGKVFRVDLADMTCSDACKKKAEEQHCACRPDCVTRDVLDRIESPEMKLALMELDREMGVDVGDGLDKADRIVASGPTPRRRSRRDGEADKRADAGSSRSKGGKSKQKPASGAGQQPSGSGEGATASGRRRRKRNGGNEGAPAPQQQASKKSTARTEDEGVPSRSQQRRRRRHLSPEERESAFTAAAAREAKGQAPKDAPKDGEAPARSRRRKHTSASQKPEVPSVAEQLAEGKVKVERRRPGDGGGAAAKQPREERAADASGEGGGQKRRRRHRSRKPKQGGSEGAAPTSGAPSGE